MLDSLPNEVVIVRRKNSWDEDVAPHGVWKIAYADFMTALMAFFLVMWLINVTDDSVRRGVAQYFNPVKLASTAPNRKGLNDPQVDGESRENGTKLYKGMLGGSDEPVDQDANFGEGLQSGHRAEKLDEKPKQGGRAATGQFTQTHSESILFSDPYAVLDTLSEKIRLEKTLEDNPQGIGSGLRKDEGAQGGQAYRDPFDPLYWQFRPGRGVDSAGLATRNRNRGDDDGKGLGQTEFALDGSRAQAAPLKDGQPDDRAGAQMRARIAATGGQGDGVQHAQGTGPSVFTEEGQGPLADPFKNMDPVVAHVMGLSIHNASETVAKTSTGTQDRDTGTAVTDREATEIAAPEGSKAEILVARISEVLEAAEGTVLEETASQIRVSREGEGALISLTDDQDFGMFAIGSAEPRPELVKLLERIGKVVVETPGQIVIKGHTDARPFRSERYDNWRLSSARAHMALYMLSRGGVAKDRFDRVEGYADRHLKISDDPLAASNRRIEIYLLEGGE